MACQKVEENVARARAFARALEWLPDSVHRRNEISRQIDNRDYQTDNQHSHIKPPWFKRPPALQACAVPNRKLRPLTTSKMPDEAHFTLPASGSINLIRLHTNERRSGPQIQLFFPQAVRNK